jgi:hypothetical protein
MTQKFDKSTKKILDILITRWKGKDMEQYFIDKSKSHLKKLKNTK